MELLRAAVPKLSRVTVLVNPTNPIHPDYFKRVQATAKTNSVTISRAQASTTSQIDAAFGPMKQERAGALIVLGDPFFGVRLHFVWVLMGCLGGFEVLGLVGVVVGPVVLTLLRELWQQNVRGIARRNVAHPAATIEQRARNADMGREATG